VENLKTDGSRKRPFNVFFPQVDRQQRIRLHSSIGSIVPWLSGTEKHIECFAHLGSKGGLVIAPEGVLKNHEKVLARISKVHFSPEETPHEVTEYLRFSATRWEVTLLREQSRYSLTLPEEPRKLDLVPSTGSRAAIFVAGEIIELWKAEKWLDHVRELGSDLDRLQDQVLDLVSDDDE
jgi:hypothetical protein